MNIINNDDKELPQEEKAPGPEEPLEKEIVEIKPQEETKGPSLEEEAFPPVEAMPLSEEKAQAKPKIKRRPNHRPKPKYQSQVSAPLKKWEEKWVEVDGEKVLFVPSGFEIMTKNGWRPLMMRADKIKK